MRVNVVDVEITEEMSQCAELKTLTEGVHNERFIASVLCKAAEWTNEGRRSQTEAEEHNRETTKKNGLEKKEETKI